MPNINELFNYDPWSELNIPKQNAYSTKRVSNEVNHSFFWFLNHHNHYGLLLNFTDEIKNILPENIPKFDNIDIIVPPNFKTIIISVKNSELSKQFKFIAHDIISNCNKIPTNNNVAIYETIISILNKWKNFFKISKKRNLSPEMRRGLFGELFFLNNILKKATTARLSVDAWQGPKGHEQDFNHNKNLFEIKTQLSSSDKIIKIASLEQLDVISGQIWIYHIGISPTENNQENSISLEDLISDIISSLGNDNFGIDIFLSNLLEIGYDHEAEYKKDKYVISFENFYKIEDDFPVITRQMISSPIVTANYSLNVNLLDKWKTDSSSFHNEVFGDQNG